MVKRLPTMRETWVRSLGQEDALEKETATHSSSHAWKIPWTEEPGGLHSMGSQRVGHDRATFVCVCVCNLALSPYAASQVANGDFFSALDPVQESSQEMISSLKLKKKKSHQVRIGLGRLVTSTQEGLSRYP